MSSVARGTSAMMDRAIIPPPGQWPVIGRRLRLSFRQLQIMQLIAAEDLTDAGIARRLGVARSSVTKQVERMYAKLGIHSRAALMVRAWQEWERIRLEAGQPPPTQPPEV